mgnify:FL=1
MRSFRGKLLLATPELVDPNFFRAVILVLEHSNEGAIGVVLNRQSDLYSVDVLPKWDESKDSSLFLHWGGPVQEESLLALGLYDENAKDELSEGIGCVKVLNLNPETLDMASVLNARLYSGYAGWSAGQLNAEISTGGWIVADLTDTDPFGDDPGDLWPIVLARQEGFLSKLAQYPDDPRMN